MFFLILLQETIIIDCQTVLTRIRAKFLSKFNFFLLFESLTNCESNQLKMDKTKKTQGKEEFLKCLICSKNFKSKQTLDAHIKFVHYKIKTHLCNECDKTFATKRDLKNHQISIHEKQRPHTCGHCGKG